jgi:hypothetical protein
MKDLQTEEIFDGRCAGDVYTVRSIEPSPRAMKVINTDRIDRRSQRLGESLEKRYILKRSISE